MKQITLDGIAHCYHGKPRTDSDYALKPLHYVWEHGKAYALLGPSGCGKTTLLNIISGLLTPSEGRLLFDETDVTHLADRATKYRPGVSISRHLRHDDGGPKSGFSTEKSTSSETGHRQAGG